MQKIIIVPNLHLPNTRFIEWAKDKKLKGNGISNNPYIVDSSIELPKNIFLSNLDVSIIFESREFNLLNLKKCKNIILKDCKFVKLTFLKCSYLIILNSDIDVLNVLKSKDLTFKTCKILTLFNYYSKRIEIFETTVKTNYFRGQNAVPNKWFLYITSLLAVTIPILIFLAIMFPDTTNLLFGIIIILTFIFMFLITKKTIIGRELKKKINLI